MESPISAIMVSSVLIIKAVLELNMSYVRVLTSSIMNMLVLPEGSYATDVSATMQTHTEAINFWVHSLSFWLCGAYGKDVSLPAQNAKTGEAVISLYCTAIHVSSSLH